MTRRDLFLTVPAAFLATAGCDKESYKEFLFRGKPYKLKVKYNGEEAKVVSVSDGTGEYGPLDPHLPFRIRQIQGSPELFIPFNPFAGRPATATFPLYFLDSDFLDEKVFILDQETAQYNGHFAVDGRSQGLALSADGSLLYVTHLEVEAGNPAYPAAPPHISIFDTSTRTRVGTINLPSGKFPRKPNLSPDGATLYIPQDGTPSGVLIVDTATRALTGEIPISAGAAGKLVITPDGSMIYAVNLQTFPARVFAIDTASATVVATLIAPSSIRDLKLGRTGSRLYVASENRIVVYDTATFTEAARIDFDPNPRFNVLDLSLDGGILFANREFVDSFMMIDTATNTFVREIGNPAETWDSSYLTVAAFGPTSAV